MQLIPLTPDYNQTFQVVLSVDGNNIPLQFFLAWNATAGYWTMKITDPKTSKVLIDGLPLITADDPTGNLLSQFSYLKIGSAFLINIGGVSDNPSENDLGINFVLIWGDSE